MGKNKTFEIGDHHRGIARHSKFAFTELDLEKIFGSVFTSILILEPCYSSENEIIDFIWVFCNQRAEDMLGIQLIGRRFFETGTGPKDHERFELYKNAFNSGKTQEVQLNLIIAGKEINASLSAIRLDAHLLLSVRDINSQLALWESEAQYRLMAASIPHILYTSTLEGHIEYANETWFEGIDLPDPLPVEFIIDKFIHPEDQTYAYACWNEVLKEGREIKYDNRIIGRDGMYRWFQNRVIPLRDDAGNIIKWFGTGTDVHDEKIAMDELSKTKQDLEDKNLKLSRLNNDLDTFVYTASHDLTAPIANISGLTELLKNELGSLLKDGQHQYLAMMQESISKLQATIFDLTRMILVDSGEDKNRLAVEFRSLFKDIQQELSQLITESGAILSSDFQVEQLIFARKNLRSVLYNLVLNALKYRSSERPLLLHISTALKGKEVVLAVHDTGLGIPEQQIPKIFGINNRLNPDIEGNGYGLYMIKRMVENNGGRIEVTSEYGKGSLFNVYFPLR